MAKLYEAEEAALKKDPFYFGPPSLAARRPPPTSLQEMDAGGTRKSGLVGLTSYPWNRNKSDSSPHRSAAIRWDVWGFSNFKEHFSFDRKLGNTFPLM